MSRQAPAGISSVSACLIVEDIEHELEFLSGVFEASIKEQRKNPQGRILQAEARIGDSTIFLRPAQEDRPTTHSILYVRMADVEDAYRQALQQGATPVEEPKDRPYGSREAAIKDAQGNTWWLVQEIRKPSNKEVERLLAEQRRSRL
jgi:PhnB protein